MKGMTFGGRPLLTLVAAAVLLGVAACGEAPTDGAGSAPTEASIAPVVTESGEVVLSCGGGEGWPASVMSEGVPGLLDETDARRAFGQILDDPKYAGEAELSLFADGIDVEYRVLRGDEKSLLLGIGRWTEEGPAERGTYYLGLERDGDRWVPDGWGTCANLGPILRDGLSWARVGTYSEGDVNTSLTVSVSELDCTGARDPRPHLKDPVVVETEDAVIIYATTTPMTGSAACPGNPSVDVQIDLDQPLSDRPLLDGSFYPPRPVSRTAS